jgi:hypothetical protein
MTLRFFCDCFVIMMAVIQISIYLAKLIIEIAKTRSGNQFCQDVFLSPLLQTVI